MEDYSKTPFIIIGTGPEARAALDIANELDVLVFGFLAYTAEEQNKEINDLLVVATLESKDAKTLLDDENLKILLAEQEIAKRKGLVAGFSEAKNELVTLVASSVEVSPFAMVGRGCIIHPGTIIQANALVGSFNLISSRVVIEPDVQVADYCNIQSGAVLGQGVQVEDGVTVGSNAVIYPGVNLGKGCVVGAGSIVLQDVAEGSQVFGNPAKVL